MNRIAIQLTNKNKEGICSTFVTEYFYLCIYVIFFFFFFLNAGTSTAQKMAALTINTFVRVYSSVLQIRYRLPQPGLERRI